jgi:hypothetical protein
MDTYVDVNASVADTTRSAPPRRKFYDARVDMRGETITNTATNQCEPRSGAAPIETLSWGKQVGPSG